MSAAAGSATGLVLIPSYDTGPRLARTIAEARAAWTPVWVVIDGSTDGSLRLAEEMAAGDPGLRVLARARNGGKGAAILCGLDAAARAGFTHVLTMDADGQHPAAAIPEFMALAAAHPGTVVLGVPVFDATAPALRVAGRRVSNALAEIETLGAGLGDCLFGFRAYPIAELRAIMAQTRWMRGFDFDPEAAVRLVWRGLRPLPRPVPVRYFRREEGGVSHFRYGRDNALLFLMHVRLLLGLLARLPRLLARRLRSSRH